MKTKSWAKNTKKRQYLLGAANQCVHSVYFSFSVICAVKYFHTNGITDKRRVSEWMKRGSRV